MYSFNIMYIFNGACNFDIEFIKYCCRFGGRANGGREKEIENERKRVKCERGQGMVVRRYRSTLSS